jgi:hypothetical protein
MMKFFDLLPDLSGKGQFSSPLTPTSQVKSNLRGYFSPQYDKTDSKGLKRLKFKNKRGYPFVL